MQWPFKILVKYATRGRPERFFGGMDTIYSLADTPKYIYTCVTADVDDSSMNNESVINRVLLYPNTRIVFGESTSKISAINRDMDNLPIEMSDWDILVNFSDDQRFIQPQWDAYVRVDFNAIFPSLDGFMSYLDPDTKGALTTYSIIGRPYYNRFGFIYDPQFKSLFCDNLADICAKALGKYHFSSTQLIHHYNPSYGYVGFEPDNMYVEQQKIGWSEDQAMYNKIIEQGVEQYLLKFIKNDTTNAFYINPNNSR